LYSLAVAYPVSRDHFVPSGKERSVKYIHPLVDMIWISYIQD